MDDRLKNIGKLIVYAKILFDKGDVFVASLLVSKVCDLMSLNDEGRKELEERFPDLENYCKQKRKNDRSVPAIKYIEYYLKSHFPDNHKLIEDIIYLKKEPHSRRNIATLRNAIVHVHDFTIFNNVVGENDQYKEFRQDTALLVNTLFELPFVQLIRDNNYGGNIKCNYEAERELKCLFSKDSLQSRDVHAIPLDTVLDDRFFSNLIYARKDIFPRIAAQLKKNNYTFLNINDINVSTVDSTSAYVWLSIPINVPTLPENLSSRKKVYVPTISIVLTPLELWIYLEFAGLNYNYKAFYYDYLLHRENFEQLTKTMLLKEDKFHVKPIFRDVRWYVFEEDRIEITEDYDSTYNKMRCHLVENLGRKLKQFNECVDKNCPITWNLMLPGWVFNYRTIEGKITIGELTEEVDRCIQGLMPLIEAIRSNTKIRKRDPIKLINRILNSNE